MTKTTLLVATTAAAACLTIAGCKKKVAAQPPPMPAVQQTASTTPPARTNTPSSRPTEVAHNSSRPTTPDAATRARIQELLDRIQDAYFDYDKHDIRPDAQKNLAADAKTLTDILKDYPTYMLTVEGYFDERVSDEYNLALGEARAKQAKEYLVGLGIPASQLRTVSYGKSRPVCTDENEQCWQKNRRAHITQAQS